LADIQCPHEGFSAARISKTPNWRRNERERMSANQAQNSKNGNGIRIRRFDPTHGQAVLELILAIQREEFDIPITADDQPDLRDIPSFYQTGIGDFFVAEAASRVVGTIGLKDIENKSVALRKMFVAQSWRGPSMKVAATLLQQALAHAHQMRIENIYLGTTDKFVAAHRFYEKNGFTLIDRSALPATFPLMAVDSRFYALRLA
jgi:N-acetylglutamate synthase-like GNAT family acetyltransferase